jgi:serine/threonine protein phosphatase PrpC
MGKINSHNGSLCVDLIKLHFMSMLTKNLKNAIKPDEVSELNFVKAFSRVITKTFKEIDALLLEKLKERSYDCGSTALVIVILGNLILCANLGDSVAFITQKSSNISLSVQMTPV